MGNIVTASGNYYYDFPSLVGLNNVLNRFNMGAYEFIFPGRKKRSIVMESTDFGMWTSREGLYTLNFVFFHYNPDTIPLLLR